VLSQHPAIRGGVRLDRRSQCSNGADGGAVECRRADRGR
jgi:hypothetical protein